MSKIACVIPAYNAQGHLAEALDCVLAQEHIGEVIVVDDGSTDATVQVARRYAGRVVLLNQSNAGPSAARNRGVAATTAPLIAFLDADDLWTPNRLITAWNAFEADPNLDVQVCLAQNQTPGGRPVGEPTPAYVAGAMVVRRTAWDRIGAFNAALPHGASLDWFVRARDAQARIQLVGQVMLLRRLHEQSFSATGAADSHKEHLSVLRASLARRRELADPTKS